MSPEQEQQLVKAMRETRDRLNALEDRCEGLERLLADLLQGDEQGEEEAI